MGSGEGEALGFTGTSRNLAKPQREVLLSALIGFREGGSEWMHNGDCIEADEAAGNMWRVLGGKIHLHPPSNPSKRAFLKAERAAEPAPYMVRNQHIADACEVLIATPMQEDEQPSGGTWRTVRMARARGIPIMLILPSGRVVKERWPSTPTPPRAEEE